MAVKIYKPTSAGRRNMSVIRYDSLGKNGPLKSQRKRLKKHSGRNNQGRITTRHQGGGNKILYRMIDFKQMKIGVKGQVEEIEYDPYRTAFIARVVYRDGDRRYILAAEGMKAGSLVLTDSNAPIEIGNRMPLRGVPVGSFVHNIESVPGSGGKLVRGAGASAQVLAQEDGYTHLKMPSGEVRKVSWECYATIGTVSNSESNLVIIGKAGRNRALGIRPTVRGKVMNPRDHPYGGGEGRTQRGTKRPKTKWGKVTGGHKTRNKKKWSSRLIVKRRK